MKWMFVLALLAPFSHAEVKPPGTILEQSCGNPEPGLRVCFATRVGDSRLYLTLTSKDAGKRIAKIRETKKTRSGTIYSASLPGPGLATVMVEYHLTVVEGTRGALGTLKAYDRVIGKARFKMEAIYHTMGL